MRAPPAPRRLRPRPDLEAVRAAVPALVEAAGAPAAPPTWARWIAARALVGRGVRVVDACRAAGVGLATFFRLPGPRWPRDLEARQRAAGEAARTILPDIPDPRPRRPAPTPAPSAARRPDLSQAERVALARAAIADAARAEQVTDDEVTLSRRPAAIRARRRVVLALLPAMTIAKIGETLGYSMQTCARLQGGKHHAALRGCYARRHDQSGEENILGCDP